MKKIFLVLFLAFAFISIQSQTSRDVLYLKNGSIIYGSIIELIPDQQVKIKTSDGSIFVYQYADVLKITKEEIPATPEKGFHMHDGFYLSLSYGASFGDIKDEIGAGESLTISDVGPAFEFAIGWAVKENILLHLTGAGCMIISPTVKSSNGSSFKSPDNSSLMTTFSGVGITYYIMPRNIFVSASVGSGSFSYNDADNLDSNWHTDPGFSFQIKAGKEWWVSKNWGLGIAASYTMLNSDYSLIGSSSSETWSSNKFSIVFNATFN
jgi:hypothetical protein